MHQTLANEEFKMVEHDDDQVDLLNGGGGGGFGNLFSAKLG